MPSLCVMMLSGHSRRNFCKALGGGLATSLLHAQTDRSELPDPSRSGIDHVVVLMMENRSFDHILGWLKGADGKQANLTYHDRNNAPHQTYHLTDYQGCGHPIPDNTYQSARAEYDNGLCDGWLRAGSNDIYSIGYYVQNDVAFLGQAAPAWTTCDHYFAATLSETFSNRMYQHTAQTDRQDNSTTLSTLPTIWDQLAAAGLSGRYYFSDIPFLALWGAKYLPISRPVPSFFLDCRTGNLPAVSFVDPLFLGEDYGLANSDHPHTDIRNGEAFMNLVYSAVTNSPAWQNTVLVINFDEWGGFFDHVAPQAAPDNNSANALRGFHVPCLVISPWSQSHRIAKTVYDHTSVLKMIEWRWSLPNLTLRDANANNLAETLDFGRKVKRASQYQVPLGPFGSACGFTPTVGAAAPAIPAGSSDWAGLAAVARTHGWI